MRGQRMFVAVVPPEPVREDLADFLAPRVGMPWIDPAQWHLTLAFLAAVPDHRVDELVDGLSEKAARHDPFAMSLAGAGSFPHAARASVLWLGVGGERAADELGALAVNARHVAGSVGANPDGKTFVPHLTLARLTRPVEATKWLRVLDTYRSPAWTVDALELIASYLGEGPSRRPRYERVASIRLGSPSDR